MVYDLLGYLDNRHGHRRVAHQVGLRVNAEERQALREKHQPCTCGACYDEGPECVWCAEADWPCDVIVMLDAYEALLEAAEQALNLPDRQVVTDRADQLFLDYIENRV